jgi:hypothetical protein
MAAETGLALGVDLGLAARLAEAFRAFPVALELSTLDLVCLTGFLALTFALPADFTEPFRAREAAVVFDLVRMDLVFDAALAMASKCQHEGNG